MLPRLRVLRTMSSEEGVDHQEAHFRPALLLRGIPADLDPASEGRAVLTDGQSLRRFFVKCVVKISRVHVCNFKTGSQPQVNLRGLGAFFGFPYLKIVRCL